MIEEDKSQKFRLKNLEKKTSTDFIKEIVQNELIINKNKKDCSTLNYIEHFLTLVSAVTGCSSISAFAYLVNISTGITSSTIGLNICAITARNKEYKSIIRKKKIEHDEIVLLAKPNLIFRSLINSYISLYEFDLIITVLKM